MKIDMKKELMNMAYTGGKRVDYLLEVDSKGNVELKEADVLKLSDIEKMYAQYYINPICNCCRHMDYQGEELHQVFYHTCDIDLYLATSDEERFKDIQKGQQVKLPNEKQKDVYFIMMNSDYDIVRAEDGFVHSEEREMPQRNIHPNDNTSSNEFDNVVDIEFDATFNIVATRLKDIYNREDD